MCSVSAFEAARMPPSAVPFSPQEQHQVVFIAPPGGVGSFLLLTWSSPCRWLQAGTRTRSSSVLAVGTGSPADLATARGRVIPDLLPELGLGITNVVSRATARADELSGAELVAGGQRLRSLVGEVRPRWLAVVGITAYRVAFAEPRAVVGRQALGLGQTPVWALPNPSGLNAHWSLPAMVAEFTRLRLAAEPGS